MTTPDPTIAPAAPISNLTEDLHPHHDPNRTTGRFTGLHPDNTFPHVDGELDMVQEMKRQAREESARTRRVSSNAARPAHPPFTEQGPDRHALGRWADANQTTTPGSLPAEDETEDVVA